jgi:hypothetical protein
MTHQEKVALMIKDLGRNGVLPIWCAPPLFRLLWAVGLEIRPPLFLPFLANFLILELQLAWLVWLLWLGAIWLFPESTSAQAAPLVLLCSHMVGLVIGFIIASELASTARKLMLPSWNLYLAEPPPWEGAEMIGSSDTVDARKQSC